MMRATLDSAGLPVATYGWSGRESRMGPCFGSPSAGAAVCEETKQHVTFRWWHSLRKN